MALDLIFERLIFFVVRAVAMAEVVERDEFFYFNQSDFGGRFYPVA